MNSNRQKKGGGVLFLVILMVVGIRGFVFAQDKTVLWTLGNWKMELTGVAEIEFVDTERDEGTLDAATTDRQGTNSMLRVDKFVLEPIFAYEKHFEARAELEYNEDDTTFLKEWGFYLKDLHPLVSLLGVELNDRFIKPERLLENYGLLGFSFWQDDSNGFVYKGGHKWAYWVATLSMGYELDDKGVNESEDFEILHDDRNLDMTDGSISGLREVGLGFGINPSLGKLGKADLLGFWFNHDLTGDDVTFLKGIANYSGSDKKARWRTGINFIYDFKNFHNFFQVIRAKDGNIDRWGVQVQPSYKIPTRYTYLKSIRPVVGYSYLDLDGIGASRADARTWDREQLIVAGIFEVAPAIKLKTEYSWNFEETEEDGGLNAHNDEFLTQIELTF